MAVQCVSRVDRAAPCTRVLGCLRNGQEDSVHSLPGRISLGRRCCPQVRPCVVKGTGAGSDAQCGSQCRLLELLLHREQVYFYIHRCFRGCLEGSSNGFGCLSLYFLDCAHY